MKKWRDDESCSRPAGSSSAAFLPAQVGAHAASKFAGRLASLKLAPPHAGILRILSATPAITQQTLAATLGMVPSRLVALVDDMEARGLIERRENPAAVTLCISQKKGARRSRLSAEFLANMHKRCSLLSPRTNGGNSQVFCSGSGMNRGSLRVCIPVIGRLADVTARTRVALRPDTSHGSVSQFISLGWTIPTLPVLANKSAY